jgi:hypothetical protein
LPDFYFTQGQLVADRLAKMWESLDDFAVITSGGQPNNAQIGPDDEMLTVRMRLRQASTGCSSRRGTPSGPLRGLHTQIGQSWPMVDGKAQRKTYLVIIRLLCLLQLLFVQKCDLLEIAA